MRNGVEARKIRKAEVINFEERVPYYIEELICIKCGHRGVVAIPVNKALKDISCPKCGPGFVIKTGEDSSRLLEGTQA